MRDRNTHEHGNVHMVSPTQKHGSAYQPRNVHRHRCTSLTYLPNVGERERMPGQQSGLGGSLIKGGHMAPPRPRVSISVSGGGQEGVLSSRFG